MWDSVVTSLSCPGGVYTPCLPGHGLCPDPPSTTDFHQAIEALVEQLPALSPALLVGYSMGGRIGLAMLLRHPERFVGGIFSGTHTGQQADQERKERLAWEENCCQQLSTEGVTSFVDAWEALPLWATQKRLSCTQKAQIRTMRTSHTAEGLCAALRTFGLGNMPDLSPDLAKTPHPIHFMTGTEDPKFCALADRATSLSPRITHQPMEGIGHNPAVEAPEGVANRIEAFASRCL